MRIVSLKAENFRNIKDQKIEFSPDTNLIFGDNAQGKTNVIEAIYYFANSKSFRTANDRDLIRFGAESAKISGIFQENGRSFEFSSEILQSGKRNFYYNNIKISKMSEFFGNLRAVLFVPEHLRIVKSGPAERRALMDSSLAQTKKSYITELYKHSQVVSEKNALLKNYKEGDADILLDIYDEKMVEIGSKITDTRKKWCEEVFKKAEHHLREMSGDELSFDYRISGTSNKGASLEVYREQIPRNRRRDIQNKAAVFGAHRDDIEIYINGIPLRFYGSQGQQRSSVIALKLAEGEWIEEKTGSAPIYLFDDILSELDERRREYILSKLRGKQVIITSCEKSEGLITAREIKVERGEYR